MEQHPVPQNVTTFQFRLIGDMTIKQFGYLAGGAILAYIFYKLPLPFFFTWPLALVAALGGFGFAFVPIEERPMDVWVLSFFKSIYSPTQYVWSHETKSAPAAQAPLPPTANVASQVTAPTPLGAQPLPAQAGLPGAQASLYTPNTSGRRTDVLQNIFLPSSAPSPSSASPAHHGPLDWIFDLITPKPRPNLSEKPLTPANLIPQMPATPPTLADRMDFSPPPVVRSASTSQQGESTTPQQAIADTEKKEHEVEIKVKTIQKELEEKPVAQLHMQEMQAQLAQLLADREKMEKELAALRNQTVPATQPAPVTPPAVTQPINPPAPPPVSPSANAARTNSSSTYASPQAPREPTVRIITPDQAIKVGLPRLTTFPNVVTGIVKDRDNNLLPGVLATVKDRDGVPLRALKTNRLGQFAASTPLPNGVYLVEIEDPRMRYTFDRAQITLNGSIVPALEIFAKSQKEITRAKLEKELFGDTANLTNPTNKPI